MSSRFTKINESFQCGHCKHTVPASKSTCRNHCTKCLYSRHVDINPGDRESKCHGLMKPIGYEPHSKKGIILIHQCVKCKFIGKNKALVDDLHEADDYDAILKLTLTE